MAKIRPANPRSSHSPTGSTQGSCGLGTEGRGCRSSWDTAWGQRDLPSTKSQAGPQQTMVTSKAQHTRSSATSEPFSPTPLWGLLSQSTPSRRQVSLSCVAQSHAPAGRRAPQCPMTPGQMHQVPSQEATKALNAPSPGVDHGDPRQNCLLWVSLPPLPLPQLPGAKCQSPWTVSNPMSSIKSDPPQRGGSSALTTPPHPLGLSQTPRSRGRRSREAGVAAFDPRVKRARWGLPWRHSG